MRRIFIFGVLSLSSLVCANSLVHADVIIRGPFGRQIVIRSSTDVRVGPGVSVTPPPRIQNTPVPGTQPLPPALGSEAVIVSKSLPVIRPDDDLELLPAPKVLDGAPNVPDRSPKRLDVMPKTLLDRSPKNFDAAPKMLANVNVIPGPAPASTLRREPIAPKDFVKNFKASSNPSIYEFEFLHPVSHKAVTVPFSLPAGTPRVSYRSNSIVFDYGRRMVEIRFQSGGRVQVLSH